MSIERCLFTDSLEGREEEEIHTQPENKEKENNTHCVVTSLSSQDVMMPLVRHGAKLSWSLMS